MEDNNMPINTDDKETLKELRDITKDKRKWKEKLV